MITLVVPTRNRAHTLEIVAHSHYQQELVDEVIFLDDGGLDDTANVVQKIAAQYPHVTTRILRNETRCGAPACRNRGVHAARNEYVLFCDDDEFLEPSYAKVCLAKLLASGAGAVSGRRVYMLDGETKEQALKRFGFGMRRTKPFRYLICEYVNGAAFSEDQELPFTNAVILTRKSLVLSFPFDDFYSRGNGYREETDFQMNLFLQGYRIMVTNDCHSIHLNPGSISGGGQRVSRLSRVVWSIYYTNYFFRKYYDRYAKKVGLRAPRLVALTAFSIFSVFREYLRPTLHRTAMSLLVRRGAHF